jgi:hypothetical protein
MLTVVNVSSPVCAIFQHDNRCSLGSLPQPPMMIIDPSASVSSVGYHLRPSNTFLTQRSKGAPPSSHAIDIVCPITRLSCPSVARDISSNGLSTICVVVASCSGDSSICHGLVAAWFASETWKEQGRCDEPTLSHMPFPAASSKQA